MRQLLLITGSRALGESPDACRWAFDAIDAALAPLARGDVVLAGGAAGPDAWAVERAAVRGLRTVELRLDGGRYEGGARVGDWVEPHRRFVVAPNVWPLERNAALVAVAAKARDAGWSARVLALRAAWARTHGTDHTASRAEAAGLAVERATYADPPATRPGHVWIDLETGGRSEQLHPILEIGAVRTGPDHLRALDAFEIKLAVPPGLHVDPEAAAVNGYTPAGWKDARPAAEALAAFLEWLPERFRVGGYSFAGFDKRFLLHACALYGLDPPGWLPDAREPQVVDPLYTVRATLKKTGRVPTASLDNACAYFGIPSPASHRALADAERARLVHLALLGKPPTTSVFDPGWVRAAETTDWSLAHG